MRYFRSNWPETRGDEYDHWGTATYWLEVDTEKTVVRQLEIYANGSVLKYDLQKQHDEYGGLSDQPLDARQLGSHGITMVEETYQRFEEMWSQSIALNA